MFQRKTQEELAAMTSQQLDEYNQYLDAMLKKVERKLELQDYLHSLAAKN